MSKLIVLLIIAAMIGGYYYYIIIESAKTDVPDSTKTVVPDSTKTVVPDSTKTVVPDSDKTDAPEPVVLTATVGKDLCTPNKGIVEKIYTFDTSGTISKLKFNGTGRDQGWGNQTMMELDVNDGINGDRLYRRSIKVPRSVNKPCNDKTGYKDFADESMPKNLIVNKGSTISLRLKGNSGHMTAIGKNTKIEINFTPSSESFANVYGAEWAAYP
jgi:hypothetical protein